jgi:molybdopterin-binding protein
VNPTFPAHLAGGTLNKQSTQHDELKRCGEREMLSARNQFHGQVKTITLGNVMAEVIVTVGDLELVSVITRGSAESLGLKVGDNVTAIIKSTEVMIDKT